jgi:hypothetical protein
MKTMKTIVQKHCVLLLHVQVFCGSRMVFCRDRPYVVQTRDNKLPPRAPCPI